VAQQHAVKQLLPAQTFAGVACVQPIPLPQARAFIEAYEPANVPGCLLAYALRIGEALAGVVMFGHEYAENLGVWDRYGYDGKIIALLRGACAPGAPHCAASKLIRGAMRLLPPRYKVITALSDATLGEHGRVYRAAGFHSLTAMATGGGRPVLVRYQGKLISERSARRRFGTSSASKLAALGFRVETVPRRIRYFAFRGPRQERRELQAAIKGGGQPPGASGR
jgi:hypothetical protein